MIQAKWFLPLLLAVLVGFLSQEGHGGETVHPGLGRATDNQAKMEIRDPYLWVYTTAFAERFDMPRENIDDTLVGAEALAFRMMYKDSPLCGYFGRPDYCRIDYRCTLDAYVPHSASIRWITEDIVGFGSPMMGSSSPLKFAAPQRQEDLKPFMFRPVGSHGGGHAVYKKGDQLISGQSIGITSYVRNIFDGIDLINLSACIFGIRPKDNLMVWFYDPEDPRNKSHLLEDTVPHHVIKMPNKYSVTIDGMYRSYDKFSMFEAVKKELTSTREKE